MRLGVLSDVHGNLPALEATLGALRLQGIDAYVHLGDVVGYGPFPNECVQLLAELGSVGVVGNHELILLGRLPPDNCWRLAQESLAWTQGVLTADARSYIETLPFRAAPAEAVIATHASLRDPEEYLRSSRQAAGELERLARDEPSAKLLLVGHTHRPRAYSMRNGEVRFGSDGTPLADDVWLLNPGSVGQSRARRAHATSMVLDLARRDVKLLTLEYDADRTRRELRRNGLDPRSHHLAPSRVEFLRRAAQSVVSRRR